MLRKTVSTKNQKKYEIKNKNISEKQSQSLASPNKKISSLISKFNDFYDDSSDEEDVDAKIKNYDVSKSWKTIEKNEGPSGRVNNKNLFSFVVHAAGIKALYSKQVGEIYYPLKRKLLRQSDEDALNQLRTLAKEAFLISATCAFSSFKQFVSIAGGDSKSSICKVVDQVESEFKQNIDKLIESKAEVLIALFKTKTLYGQDKDAHVIAKISDELSSQLLSRIKNQIQLRETGSEREKIKIQLRKLAQEHLFKLMRELGIDKNTHNEGKLKAIEALQLYKGPFQNLAQQAQSILLVCQGDGYVTNMLFKFIQKNDLQNEIMHAYIKDLMFIHEAKQIKKFLTEVEENQFKKFFTIDETSLIDEFNSYFQPLLKANLENSFKLFYRPTFAKSHTFASKNPYEFYSNIRLSNRSQKRQIQNLQNTIFKHDYCAKLWKLIDLPQAEVCESQEILDASFGRKDIVEGLGNYETVIDSIKQIKVFFKTKNTIISDATIAGWIRSIFKGIAPDLDLPQIDRIVLIQKLQSITFLLLGCEGVRIPAMIVINQMLLDLIMENVWSFDDAFDFNQANSVGDNKIKIMPMAPKGAVSVARALESNYREFMPYSYFYRGIEEGEKKSSKYHLHDLISAEAKIVEDWIELKSKLPTKMTKSQLANWILDLIEMHFSPWFEPDQTSLVKTNNLEEKFANLKI